MNPLSSAIRATLPAGKDTIGDIYDDPKPDFAIERKADNPPPAIADKRANARIMKERKLQHCPH